MELGKVPSTLGEKWNEVKSDQKISTGDIVELFNEAISDGNLAKDEEKFINSLMSGFKNGDHVVQVKEGKSEASYQLVLGDENEYKSAIKEAYSTVKANGFDKTDSKEFKGFNNLLSYQKLFTDK